ncbi:hypothetical protein V1527DRAFT_467191 [Lipomyces starkeyi]
MSAAVQLGVGIFCHAHIRYSLACRSTSHIHPRWRVQPTLSAVSVTSQNLRLDALSVLRGLQGALPRKGCPRGTRRLLMSAEIIQIVADRIEKVRRCRSCHKVGHTRHKCSNLLNQQSSQGTDERGCALTQTTNTIEEMAKTFSCRYRSGRG